VRPKTNRRIMMLSPGLVEPLVSQFAEAPDDAGLLAFMDKFGIVTASAGDNVGVQERAWDDILSWQQQFRRFLKGAAEGGSLQAAARIEFSIGMEHGKRPAVTLRPQSLVGLMWVEAATLLGEGTHLNSCHYCGQSFMVGPGSTRRSDSIYCSSPCRFKASRAARRKARK
jgi:hypothetical protein